MYLLHLPQTPYPAALEIQHRAVSRKLLQGGPDLLILLEHPPTVTLGIRGNEGHLLVSPAELESRHVALHRVDRGGQATYHGPGQLVGYPIVDLRARNCSVRDYVALLEKTLIGALSLFGVTGFGRPGTAGVWTGTQDKIASIGVRIRKRITSHGFSINIAMPENPGDLIVSCGMPGIRMVNLNEIVENPVSIEQAREAVAAVFSSVFGVTFVAVSLEEVMQ